jgi:ribonuclease D
MTPDLVRNVCWEGPADLAQALRSGGAREWQVAMVLPALQAAWPDTAHGSR